MISPFRSSLFLLALTGSVLAHGDVSSVTIDGQSYPGANGPAPSASSPWRKVVSGDPVTDLTSTDLVCGRSAALATGMATAKPGSSLQIYWVDEGNGNWEHNVGPVQTWMAQCDGDCTSFTPSSSTNWFKISELGQITPGSSSAWVQSHINSGAPVNVTIPSNCPSGNYLLRHEIVALQNAGTQGLAEFYPACLQLTVSGSGTTTPSPTVHFPGAYSPTDPGILVNVYNGPFTYVYPGGPVSNIHDPLSDTDDDASNPSAAAPVSASPAGQGGSSNSGSNSGNGGSSGSQAPLSNAGVSGSHICRVTKPSSTAPAKRRRSLSSLASDSLAFMRQQGISAHQRRRLMRGIHD